MTGFDIASIQGEMLFVELRRTFGDEEVLIALKGTPLLPIRHKASYRDAHRGAGLAGCAGRTVDVCAAAAEAHRGQY